MISQLKDNLSKDEIVELSRTLQGKIHQEGGSTYIVSSSGIKSIPESCKNSVDKTFVFDDDIQLSSRKFHPETREVRIGNHIIGGNHENLMVIGGPCSVEGEEQLMSSAKLMSGLGLSSLRGGCYKPRTSPYSFQGMELEGLELLKKAREEYGLTIVTEAKDASHIDEVASYSDIIQVGTKAMYNQALLKACGKSGKPVLLKRGFSSTLKECVQMAEFIMINGNPNVILCERGIRTFEERTRFTLDLCGVAYLKQHTNLPIIIDPSHAMGYAYGIADLSRASVAMGVDGLLIEVHPNPKVAKSDASQQLNFEEFTKLHGSLKPLAELMGQKMV